MSYYFTMAAAGILALLGAIFLMEEENLCRRKNYTDLLHTELVLHNVPDCSGVLSCTLYRTHNVIGRRKRRSDICLDCYRDGRISRSHAVLSYDGRNFRIRPVFRMNGMRYTQILVENELVPPTGMVVRHGDRICIAGHIMQLLETDEGKQRW